MSIADIDADSETRTLLDIGDGPLSIVFEQISTPGRPRWHGGDDESDAISVSESEDALELDEDSEDDSILAAEQLPAYDTIMRHVQLMRIRDQTDQLATYAY